MVATKVTCVVSARASLVPRVDVDAMQTGERLQNNWSHGQTSTRAADALQLVKSAHAESTPVV